MTDCMNESERSLSAHIRVPGLPAGIRVYFPMRRDAGVFGGMQSLRAGSGGCSTSSRGMAVHDFAQRRHSVPFECAKPAANRPPDTVLYVTGILNPPRFGCNRLQSHEKPGIIQFVYNAKGVSQDDGATGDCVLTSYWGHGASRGLQRGAVSLCPNAFVKICRTRTACPFLYPFKGRPPI